MWSERNDFWTLSFCSCLCSYFMSFFLFLISSAMKMDGCLLFILATKLNFVLAKKLPSWECFRICTNTSACIFSFHKPKQNQGSPTQPSSAGCTVPMSTEASSFFCSFSAPYWSMCPCFASFTSDAWKLAKAPGTGPTPTLLHLPNISYSRGRENLIYHNNVPSIIMNNWVDSSLILSFKQTGHFKPKQMEVRERDIAVME